MYFKKHPKIRYRFDADNPNVETVVVDIFRRVNFIERLKTQTAAFNKVRNEDAARPDVFAGKKLKDPELHWSLMMFNDVIDPRYDWVLSEYALEEYCNIKYPGSAFFVEFETERARNESSSSSSSSENQSSSSSEASVTSSSSSTTNSSSSVSLSSNTNSSSSSSLSSSSTEAAATSNSSSSSFSSKSSATNSSSSSTEDASYPEKCGSSSSSATNSTSSNDSESSETSVEYVSFAKGETVTFTGGATGIVHDWDATLKKLVVKSISGGTVVDGDVSVLNNVSVTGGTSAAVATVRKVVSDNKLALHHFSGNILNADLEVMFTDKPLDPASHLNGYIYHSITTNVVTNYEYEIELNEERRNIRVFKQRYVEQLKPELSRVLSER